MSTSGDQPTRPLTRRELRELRAQGGEAAVRAALNAAAASSADAATEPVAPPAASDAEVTPTVEGPADTRREPHVVATSSPEAESHPPLTRKELRRLRTNEVPIVLPEQSDESEAADTAEPAEEPVSDTPPGSHADRGAGSAPADDATGTHEPASFDVIDVEPAEVGVDDEDAAPTVLEPTTSSTEIPTLNPSFGAGVGQRTGDHVGPTSFDALMEQQYTQTSPSSIIMTSSLALPDGIGSTGAATGTTDGRDVDAVLIDGELPASSSPTPIAASAAISTQKSAHEVIRPPAPDKGRGLLLGLGITAGALGIVAIGTLAALYFTGVFN